MKFIRKKIGNFIRRFKIGKKIQNDPYYLETKRLTDLELSKQPKRTEIINYFLSLINGDYYLEIGVRNPEDNYNQIYCKHKYSVDPGIEFNNNHIDFNMNSDDFFTALKSNNIKILTSQLFDVIFIDGLHLADQVEKDIYNALKFIKDQGFIILHDCNPPTEHHQREDYKFRNSPAKGFWNGTTWKAFYKFRHQQDLFSICFDTDFGVGVISKQKLPLFNNLSLVENPFFEFSVLDKNKRKYLNLYDFYLWKNTVEAECLKLS